MEAKKMSLKELMSMDIKDLTKKKSKKIKSKPQKEKELKSEIISFDIGSDYTKIVVGKYYKGKLSISDYLEFETPKDSVNDGLIINERILADKIQILLNENKIKAKYASFTTNSTTIINREIMIPKVDEDEVESVIKFEMEQYLPINLNDYIVQYIELEEIERENSNKVKVYVIAYPEKMARGYYELLKVLKLKPVSLDVAFNSLSKLITCIDKINEDSYDTSLTNVFIDIGSNFTSLSIYKNGKLDFTRIIRSNHIDTTYDEMIFIQNLSEEIERIIRFYNNKYIGNKVDGIYILGGISSLYNIHEYIGEKINIPTKKINNIKFNEANISIDNIENYLNAIGALIRS